MYAKGYTEKSHSCLFVGLVSLYIEDNDLCSMIRFANMLKESRHETVYGGKIVSKAEALAGIEFAEGFLSACSKIING